MFFSFTSSWVNLRMNQRLIISDRVCWVRRVNLRMNQRLIISDRVCRVRRVWCWKTQNSLMIQAKHITDDTFWPPNVVSHIFKVLKKRKFLFLEFFRLAFYFYHFDLYVLVNTFFSLWSVSEMYEHYLIYHLD